jgi:hypothetical protein
MLPYTVVRSLHKFVRDGNYHPLPVYAAATSPGRATQEEIKESIVTIKIKEKETTTRKKKDEPSTAC